MIRRILMFLPLVLFLMGADDAAPPIEQETESKNDAGTVVYLTLIVGIIIGYLALAYDHLTEWQRLRNTALLASIWSVILSPFLYNAENTHQTFIMAGTGFVSAILTSGLRILDAIEARFRDPEIPKPTQEKPPNDIR